MDMLSRLMEPQYFYVTCDNVGKHVDMGYVPVSLVEGLVATAVKAGCKVTLVVPNNARH